MISLEKANIPFEIETCPQCGSEMDYGITPTGMAAWCCPGCHYVLHENGGGFRVYLSGEVVSVFTKGKHPLAGISELVDRFELS